MTIKLCLLTPPGIWGEIHTEEGVHNGKISSSLHFLNQKDNRRSLCVVSPRVCVLVIHLQTGCEVSMDLYLCDFLCPYKRHSKENPTTRTKWYYEGFKSYDSSIDPKNNLTSKDLECRSPRLSHLEFTPGP